MNKSIPLLLLTLFVTQSDTMIAKESFIQKMKAKYLPVKSPESIHDKIYKAEKELNDLELEKKSKERDIAKRKDEISNITKKQRELSLEMQQLKNSVQQEPIKLKPVVKKEVPATKQPQQNITEDWIEMSNHKK